jgi:DNA polymerase III delta subunit
MEPFFQFIFGSDEFFVELKAKAVIETLANTSLEVIDGQMSTVSDLKRVFEIIVESLRTVDFFEPHKCVWLRNTNLFASTSPAITEAGQDAVEKWLHFLKRLPHETYFFISASMVDKRTKLFKTIQSLAYCTELEETEQGSRLHALIEKLSRQYTVTMDPNAVEIFIQKLNGHPRMISNEFEKLACFNNFRGIITLDCVLSNTPTVPNDEFFEPVEAFYAGDFKRYLQSLGNHFLLHKEVRSVLNALQNRNRLLLQMAYLRQKHAVTSCDKQSLASVEPIFRQFFGPMGAKNTFCVFSQNPWYVSRLKPHFPYEVLLQLQMDFVEVFDQLLKAPRNAYPIMENLARKTFACLKNPQKKLTL